MQGDKIKMDIKGHVKFFKVLPSGIWDLIYEHANTLDPANSKLIVSRLLGGMSYELNKIECLKALGSLAEVTSSVDYPTVASVRFTSIFDEASFNDTVDEIRLNSGGAGLTFSSITGLSVLKTNAYRLGIQWILTINSL